MSVALRTELSPAWAVRYTMLAGVCAARALEERTGHPFLIKWVNDLYLSGRKVAGILTEGALDPSGQTLRYAVVGIGINLAEVAFPPELAPIATSVEGALGVRLSARELGEAIGRMLLATDPTAPTVLAEYRARSFLLGRAVRVTGADGCLEAVAESVAEDGSLVVRLPDGARRTVVAGDVSVRERA